MINVPFRISSDKRIKAIEHSLSCFRFSVASLMPLLVIPVAVPLVKNVAHSNLGIVIGIFGWAPLASIIFASLAWSHFHQARAASLGEWNPARKHLACGRIFSSIALLLSVLLALFFVCAILGLLGDRPD